MTLASAHPPEESTRELPDEMWGLIAERVSDPFSRTRTLRSLRLVSKAACHGVDSKTSRIWLHNHQPKCDGRHTCRSTEQMVTRMPDLKYVTMSFPATADTIQIVGGVVAALGKSNHEWSHMSTLHLRHRHEKFCWELSQLMEFLRSHYLCAFYTLEVNLRRVEPLRTISTHVVKF